ncbi:hypothetical protein [Kitasatospora sp. NPDC001683]
MHTTARPATARLLAVCALLLGLFLMHGAPVSTGGCHEPMAMAMVAPVMAPEAHTHPNASPAPAVVGPAAHLAAGADATGSDSCVSTPAHDRLTVDTPPLLAILALALLAGWAPAWRRALTTVLRRRGPPTGGRSLLLLVSVART